MSLCVIHHRQNPIVSTKYICIYYNTKFAATSTAQAYLPVTSLFLFVVATNFVTDIYKSKLDYIMIKGQAFALHSSGLIDNYLLK
jgi:hypothetical protein